MSPISISLIVFVCVFASTLVGMSMRGSLLERYLSDEAKDVIKLALGVIATMNALVLGLLISTAKGSYDLKRGQLTQIGADAILIDRTLALYGSQAKAARSDLRGLVENLVDQLE